MYTTPARPSMINVHGHFHFVTWLAFNGDAFVWANNSVPYIIYRDVYFRLTTIHQIDSHRAASSLVVVRINYIISLCGCQLRGGRCGGAANAKCRTLARCTGLRKCKMQNAKCKIKNEARIVGTGVSTVRRCRMQNAKLRRNAPMQNSKCKMQNEENEEEIVGDGAPTSRYTECRMRP